MRRNGGTLSSRKSSSGGRGRSCARARPRHRPTPCKSTRRHLLCARTRRRTPVTRRSEKCEHFHHPLFPHCKTTRCNFIFFPGATPRSDLTHLSGLFFVYYVHFGRLILLILLSFLFLFFSLLFIDSCAILIDFVLLCSMLVPLID